VWAPLMPSCSQRFTTCPWGPLDNTVLVTINAVCPIMKLPVSVGHVVSAVPCGLCPKWPPEDGQTEGGTSIVLVLA
jgi:hypothetical protein